jgi:hypothetical protein
LSEHFLYLCDNSGRPPLKDALVGNLFPSSRVAGSRLDLSEKRRSSRKVAFGLGNGRLFHQGVNVVRHDLQNLVELPERFGETPQRDIELGMSSEQTHIARVEPLGFVEVGFTSLPLPLIACDKGERLRN